MNDNAHTSTSELQRLRRDNEMLMRIIGQLMLEREAAKKISLARETFEKNPWLSKSGVARTFGIARGTLYLKSK